MSKPLMNSGMGKPLRLLVDAHNRMRVKLIMRFFASTMWRLPPNT
jgi:hypothetical protein